VDLQHEAAVLRPRVCGMRAIRDEFGLENVPTPTRVRNAGCGSSAGRRSGTYAHACAECGDVSSMSLNQSSLRPRVCGMRGDIAVHRDQIIAYTHACMEIHQADVLMGPLLASKRVEDAGRRDVRCKEMRLHTCHSSSYASSHVV
jgi:hypothetical protein